LRTPRALHYQHLAALIALLTMLLLVSSSAVANTLSIEQMGKFPYSLSPHIEIYEDSSQALSIEEISATKAEDWMRNFTGTASFGFTDSAYWVKLTLNNSETTSKHFLLEQSYPLMDEVTFYSPQKTLSSLQRPPNQPFDVIQTGDSLPFSTREIPHHNFVFTLELPPTSTSTYFLRFKARDTVEINLKLWSADSFSASDHNTQMIYGIFYGAILVLVVFNLSVYFALRDLSYVYYVATLIAFTLVEANLNGLTFEYLLPNFPELNKISRPFLIAVSMSLNGLFCLSYLNLQDKTTRAIRFVLFLTKINLLSVFAIFFLPFSLSISIIMVLGITTISTILIISFSEMRNGNTSATFYLSPRILTSRDR